MRKFWKDEKGSVLVLAAVAMVVIFGFAALAIDGGNLYHRDMRLQDIADACALAACQELAASQELADNVSQQYAIDKAVDYAELNGIVVIDVASDNLEKDILYGDETGKMRISFPTDNKVKVDLDIDTKLYFARVMGFNNSNVAVASAAEFGVAQQQEESDLWPIGVFGEVSDFKIGTTEKITEGPGDGTKGNYGFIRLEDENMPGLVKFLSGEEQASASIGEKLDTQPGQGLHNNKGRNAIISHFNCGCNTNSTDYSQHKEDCSRFVTIAITSLPSKGGKSEVEILGFLKVFLVSYTEKGNGNNKNIDSLTATFVKQVDPSGEIAPGDPNLIQAVRLVE